MDEVIWANLDFCGRYERENGSLGDFGVSGDQYRESSGSGGVVLAHDFVGSDDVIVGEVFRRKGRGDVSEAMLILENVTVKVGSFVLPEFSLEIAKGECVALMGPSGCGKTTLMETVCGLRRGLTGGQIFLDGLDVSELPPGARGIGLVPQDIALFPTLTVREQLEFGPKLHGWNAKEIRERAEGLAADLGLEKLMGRVPLGLSGGEARRVALGRALALKPRLLCLDEALSGLDEERHEEVLQVIRKMIESEGVTALHVTHSRKEAEAISDRVVVMGV